MSLQGAAGVESRGKERNVGERTVRLAMAGTAWSFQDGFVGANYGLAGEESRGSVWLVERVYGMAGKAGLGLLC